MGTPNSPYITIVIISGVLNILLAIYAYSKKSTFSGIPAFILMSFASAVYSFGFAFELASDSLEEIKRWMVVEYAAIPFIPPLNLIIVLHYIGLEKLLTRVRLGMLFTIPVMTSLLVATNDAHHIYYRSIYLRAGTESPMVDIVMGNWYIVHVGFSFACIAVSVFLLLNQLKPTESAYRNQLITLLIGLILPTAASILYLMGLTPYGMDIIPIVLSVTSSLYIWAILSAHMFTVVPIAKENLFDSMRDGVLVLDTANNLVDYNQAAAGMIPSLNSSAIGQNIDRVWTQMNGAEFLQAANQDNHEQGEDEIKWEIEQNTVYYQIRPSTIRKYNGKYAGKMIVMIDVTEQKQIQERLQNLAYYDGLTQIYNRTHFLNQCGELLDWSLLANQPLSLILFDIDLFKSVNDNYGHALGDQALLHVVSICKSLLRPGDLFGRYGGEEFVICLPSVSLEEAGQIADNIREKISSTPMMTSQGPISLTASFGAAEASSSGCSLESMLKDADQALYCSKRAGRNMTYLVSGEIIRKWGLASPSVS